MPAPSTAPLIVFDGECVLCCANAQFVLRHDRRGRFRLITAQGPTGEEIYRRLGLSTQSFDTMILVEGERAFTESDAAIRIAVGLGWPWRLAGVARLIPRPLRDGVYRIVARNRFKLFGRRATCWRPSPEVMERIV